jgi:hypothetical protein
MVEAVGTATIVVVIVIVPPRLIEAILRGSAFTSSLNDT